VVFLHVEFYHTEFYRANRFGELEEFAYKKRKLHGVEGEKMDLHRIVRNYPNEKESLASIIRVYHYERKRRK